MYFLQLNNFCNFFPFYTLLILETAHSTCIVELKRRRKKDIQYNNENKTCSAAMKMYLFLLSFSHL